jgi:hypothetical protein
MAIQVDWDGSGRVPEKSVIYWTFDGEWTWDQFAEMDKRAYELSLEMTPTVVDVLVDMRASSRIPFSGAIGYFSRSIRRNPPNRGSVVIFGASGIVRALEPVLRRLNPGTSDGYQIIETIDEAYQFLEKRRKDRANG